MGSSTYAILSLPHKCRVPLRRKRSLGYARDDDTEVRFLLVTSHSFFPTILCSRETTVSTAVSPMIVIDHATPTCR